MKRTIRRIISGVAAVALSAAMVAPMTANAAVEKLESVYVNADAFGKPTSVTVSEQLKGAAQMTGTLKDKSSLTDIKNIKGDETFEQHGEDITWNLAGNDIYYQGKTTKELPVSVKLTYFLDGTEVNPKDIVGKSGKLKINVEYANLSGSMKKIGDKEEKIFTPFLMVTTRPKKPLICFVTS